MQEAEKLDQPSLGVLASFAERLLVPLPDPMYVHIILTRENRTKNYDIHILSLYRFFFAILKNSPESM